MFEDLLTPSTVEDILQKLNSEIEKFAKLAMEIEEIDKRRKELSVQIDDTRYEIDRLQEAHVNLMVNKIRSN